MERGALPRRNPGTFTWLTICLYARSSALLINSGSSSIVSATCLPGISSRVTFNLSVLPNFGSLVLDYNRIGKVRHARAPRQEQNSRRGEHYVRPYEYIWRYLVL